MASDIRLSTEFWDHPKTIKMIRRLGLEGVRSLQILWLWARVNRPNGVLTGMDSEDIEIAAKWGGEAERFVNESLTIRWIDVNERNNEKEYRLHDWETHNPWSCETTERGDKARFSRMAKTHPEEHKRLIEMGRNFISESEFRELKKNNDSLTIVNASLTPSPSPSPSPKERKDITSQIGGDANGPEENGHYGDDSLSGSYKELPEIGEREQRDIRRASRGEDCERDPHRLGRSVLRRDSKAQERPEGSGIGISRTSLQAGRVMASGVRAERNLDQAEGRVYSERPEADGGESGSIAESSFSPRRGEICQPWKQDAVGGESSPQGEAGRPSGGDGEVLRGKQATQSPKSWTNGIAYEGDSKGRRCDYHEIKTERGPVRLPNISELFPRESEGDGKTEGSGSREGGASCQGQRQPNQVAPGKGAMDGAGELKKQSGSLFFGDSVERQATLRDDGKSSRGCSKMIKIGGSNERSERDSREDNGNILHNVKNVAIHPGRQAEGMETPGSNTGCRATDDEYAAGLGEKASRNRKAEAVPTRKKELDQEAIKLATWLAEDMLSDDPLHQNLINGKRSKTIERWSSDIEKIHRIDGREWSVIDHVLKWARSHHFWRGNIESGKKFREKFSRLYGESGGRNLEQKRERKNPPENTCADCIDFVEKRCKSVPSDMRICPRFTTLAEIMQVEYTDEPF